MLPGRFYAKARVAHAHLLYLSIKSPDIRLTSGATTHCTLTADCDTQNPFEIQRLRLKDAILAHASANEGRGYAARHGIVGIVTEHCGHGGCSADCTGSKITQPQLVFCCRRKERSEPSTCGSATTRLAPTTTRQTPPTATWSACIASGALGAAKV